MEESAVKFLEKLAQILKRVGGILCIAGAVILIVILILYGMVSEQTYGNIVPWLFPWVFGFPGGAVLMVLGSTLSERLRRPSGSNMLYERILKTAEPVFQGQLQDPEKTQLLVCRTQGGRLLEKRETTGKNRTISYRYVEEKTLEEYLAGQRTSGE